MDIISKHLMPLARRFNLAAPIASIGFLPRKTERVRTVFDSYNFSFILEGRGEYLLRGERHEVVAPCVIRQWPGEPMDYGPDSWWYEVYFIYGPEQGDFFREKGLIRDGEPMWRIAEGAVIRRRAQELYELDLSGDGVADRCDLLCESMIVESLIAAAPSVRPGVEEEKIRQVAADIRRNCAGEYDYPRLARECGMSLSTFRRLWLKHIGMPPARYRSNLLRQEACRMLVESNAAVKEIALSLGFDDPLYFSRWFHDRVGRTPTEYRRRNQPFRA